MGVETKIQHFGVFVRKSEGNKISRENYALIDKHNSIWTPNTPKWHSHADDWKKYFEDETCTVYNDSYCEELREKCLINFDKNMAFFNQLPLFLFEEAVARLAKSQRGIKEIFDLNECKGVCGVYVMVLDGYKQVYIGQTKDIKQRIMRHWSAEKPFDRLIFGDVNDSVLSIDSFGALDTTRIFVLATEKLDHYEVKLQKNISPYFKLNRMAGGVPVDQLDLITKTLDRNMRPLKDLHSEEYAERYEKEVEVAYFERKEACSSEVLAEGDAFCLERTNRGKLLAGKYYGKIVKRTKTRLWVHPYCRSTEENCCFLKGTEEKRRSTEEIQLKKTMLFSKVEIVIKKELQSFWRSKKIPHLEA